MDFDWGTIAQQVESGTLRENLERMLVAGFQALHDAGEPLPPASYYAAKIAEIIDRQSEQPLSKDDAFYLYQEVLLACENARREVLGEEAPPQ